MTPIEDPASVTIPSSATTKETTSDHDFVTSGTTSGLNTSNSMSTADNTHNQSLDGQKDTARHSTGNDGEAFDRKF